jgi:3-methyladenine DNA glycosylase AlkD
MNELIKNKITNIKNSFRLRMNGVAAKSMRDKGVDYKINWGISIPQLKEMAKEYGKDYDLAIELWKENIRECKILAILIMPSEKMIPEIVDLWMEQTNSLEIAELASFILYQNLDYAPLLAYRWMASEKEIEQISGYLVLGRLFKKSQIPNERGINEYLDQVKTALGDKSISVRHAAMNNVQCFIQLGEEYYTMAKLALKGTYEI